MRAVKTREVGWELIGLRLEYDDWPNSQLHIRRTLNHGKFMEPKSKASRRKIDLAHELIHELKKWKLACPKGELDLIFPTEEGTPPNAANLLYRRFSPALRRAGLPRMRFHNLRHTYASLLIAQGEHSKYIQSQLGHSSINLLGDYNGLTLKISLRNPDLSVLPLFQISEVYLDNSSAMRTLDKFFGLQANPVEFEFLVTMWA